MQVHLMPISFSETKLLQCLIVTILSELSNSSAYVTHGNPDLPDNPHKATKSSVLPKYKYMHTLEFSRFMVSPTTLRIFQCEIINLSLKHHKRINTEQRALNIIAAITTMTWCAFTRQRYLAHVHNLATV